MLLAALPVQAKKTSSKGKEKELACKAKKTSSKGKEKKLARKAENERAAALKQQLRALSEAWAAGDALLAAQYPAFLRYERQGLAAALHAYAAPHLPLGLLEWALALTRQHMAALYDACPDWGWSDAKKRAELAHPEARYLVAFAQQAPQQAQQQQQEQPSGAEQQQGEEGQQTAAAGPAAAPEQENCAAAGNGGGSSSGGSAGVQPAAAAGGAELARGQPVAFLHFRFEEEEGEAVLYCYEIQVAAAVQGLGLGRFLMQLLELMGRRSGMARLMLTVFHQNQAARALYRRLGYVLDDDSPGAVDPAGDHKYEILTKRLVQPAAATRAA